jgi:hypothetical protein
VKSEDQRVSPRFRNTGKIAKALIIPPHQLSLLAEDEPSVQLVRILEPGASTERYQRTWRVGRTRVDDGILYGRLGFVGSAAADLWNEENKDFEDTRTPSGVAAPFAVRLSDFRLIFQTRGSDIQVTSVTGALRGILRDGSGQDWRIETARHEMSFHEWVQTVDSVIQMRFNIEPPNPNYKDRPDLERLIEGANLSAAEIVLRSDIGILTEADIVRQLLEHVDLGYGRDAAVGERTVQGEIIEAVYSSELNGESAVTIVPANPETGEVEPETLRQELMRPDDLRPAGQPKPSPRPC